MMTENSQLQMITKFSCEKCRFSTKDPNRFRTHAALHNDIKFACSHCDYVSYTKGEFQRHLVKHTGKFPYTCEYCGYGAIRNDYIIKHIKRIHCDGKIQCSVSVAENDIHASVNLIQNQVQNYMQEISQKSISNKSEEIIDLTNDIDSCTSPGTLLDSNGNISSVYGEQVEVEVISPVQDYLYPGVPLTVIAPSTFKVPPSCFAQIVEIKSVNNKYYLILKCLEKADSGLLDMQENTCEERKEPDNAKAVFSTELSATNVTPCLLEGDTTLNNTFNSIKATNSVPDKGETYTANMTLPLQSQANNKKQDISHALEGPVISSVFSLSSNSENILEGIHWESSSKSSIEMNMHEETVETLQSSLSNPKIRSVANVTDALYNCSELEINKEDEKDKKNESSKERDSIGQTHIRQAVGTEVQLPHRKQSLLSGTECESQSSYFETMVPLQTSLNPLKIKHAADLPTDVACKCTEPEANKEHVDKRQNESFEEQMCIGQTNNEKQSVNTEIQLLHSKLPLFYDKKCERQSSGFETMDPLQCCLSLPKSKPTASLTTTACQYSELLENKDDKVENESSEEKMCIEQTSDVKESIDTETPLPHDKPSLLSEKKCKLRLSSSLFHPRKKNRHKSSSQTMETNICTKPQTLFLSCDKNVIMQPLTCAVQQNYKNVTGLLCDSNSWHSLNNSSEQEQIRNGERTPKILRHCKTQTSKDDNLSQKQPSKSMKKQSDTVKSSSKQKIKPLSNRLSSASKGNLLQNSRLLGLLPVKGDQLIQIPKYNQPVVVLNHPSVESLEAFRVMKVINKFKGNIITVTLSRSLCEQKL